MLNLTTISFWKWLWISISYDLNKKIYLFLTFSVLFIQLQSLLHIMSLFGGIVPFFILSLINLILKGLRLFSSCGLVRSWLKLVRNLKFRWFNCLELALWFWISWIVFFRWIKRAFLTKRCKLVNRIRTLMKLINLKTIDPLRSQRTQKVLKVIYLAIFLNT